MNIAFLFYEGMTALDAIGPHEVLSRIPEANIQRVALKSGPVRSDSANLTFNAEYSLDEVTTADVLIVPGAARATSLNDQAKTLEWIQHIHRKSTWTTSVCTGSLILGAAGILQGMHATSHWAVVDRLAHWGATVIDQRIVQDGKLITSAGVSAGIDMAIYLSAKLTNQETAKALQYTIEYAPEPPYSLDEIKRSSPELIAQLRQKMLAKFEKQ